MSQAREALAEKRFAQAVRLSKMAIRIAASDKSLRGQAEGLTRQLDKIGQNMLAEGKQKYAIPDYPGALKIYQRVAVIFAGLPCGGDARERMDAASKDPTVAAVLKEVKAASLYEPIAAMITATRKKMPRPTSAASTVKWVAPPDEAVVAKMPPKDQAEILKRLGSVCKLFRDSQTGKKAVALQKRLQADKTIVAAVKKWQGDETVRRLLARARMYRAAEKDQVAAKYYQQLLKKHPRSQYAAEAQKELLALRGRP